MFQHTCKHALQRAGGDCTTTSCESLAPQAGPPLQKDIPAFVLLLRFEAASEAGAGRLDFVKELAAFAVGEVEEEEDEAGILEPEDVGDIPDVVARILEIGMSSSSSESSFTVEGRAAAGVGATVLVGFSVAADCEEEDDAEEVGDEDLETGSRGLATPLPAMEATGVLAGASTFLPKK